MITAVEMDESIMMRLNLFKSEGDVAKKRGGKVGGSRLDRVASCSLSPHFVGDTVWEYAG